MLLLFNINLCYDTCIYLQRAIYFISIKSIMYSVAEFHVYLFACPADYTFSIFMMT